MKCPKCLGQLEKRSVSVYRTSSVKELHGAGAQFALEVDQCFVCGGVWFDKSELDKYLTEHMHAVDSPSVGTELNKAFDHKIGDCPRCQRPLVKKPFSLDSRVTIDSCEQCHGVWLDAAEIDRVERIADRRQKPSFFGRFAELLGRPRRT